MSNPRTRIVADGYDEIGFSSFPPEPNRRLLDEAGFERLLDELVTFLEPGGEATFRWVLARS
jgi:hypothetical protein